MNTPKISIIIPVYNVEKYINKCIDSILNQTFTNFEVIIINDGSTDNSGYICNNYAVADNRVKVFHGTNKGVANARNQGIIKSKGEYIIFVDSDDYLEQNACKYLYEEAIKSKADVVLCGINIFYEDTDENEVILYNQKETHRLYTNKEVIERYLTYEIRGYSCNRITSRKFMIDNNIKFSENITFEDMYPTLKVLHLSNYISIINIPLYNYRQRKDSLSKSRKEKDIKDYINQVNRCIKYCDKFRDDYKLNNSIMSFEVKNYLNAVNWYIKLFRCDRSQVYKNYNSFFKDLNINYKLIEVIKCREISKGYKIIYILWKAKLYHIFIKFNII